MTAWPASFPPESRQSASGRGRRHEEAHRGPCHGRADLQGRRGHQEGRGPGQEGSAPVGVYPGRDSRESQDEILAGSTAPAISASILRYIPLHGVPERTLRQGVSSALSCSDRGTGGLGCEPHCVLEIPSGGQNRLDRIYGLIEACGASVHDLSRVVLVRSAQSAPIQHAVRAGARLLHRPTPGARLLRPRGALTSAPGQLERLQRARSAHSRGDPGRNPELSPGLLRAARQATAGLCDTEVDDTQAEPSGRDPGVAQGLDHPFHPISFARP